MLKKRLRRLACKYRHWDLLAEAEAEEIPEDVPKGHLVVYVGDDRKRFVIHVSILGHPLFRALLDLAHEVYEFSQDSKLRIPCDEAIFLGVLRCVDGSTRRRERRICWLCF